MFGKLKIGICLVYLLKDKDLLLDDNEQAEARKAFANLDGGGRYSLFSH